MAKTQIKPKEEKVYCLKCGQEVFKVVNDKPHIFIGYVCYNFECDMEGYLTRITDARGAKITRCKDL